MAYKKGNVGIKRHPELYTGDDYVPVFGDVETELKMWKAAEKFNKIINKGDFDARQMMFIVHYLMCLQRLNDDQIYMLHSWMLYKTTQSQAKQAVLEHTGCSAKQKVKRNEI